MGVKIEPITTYKVTDARSLNVMEMRGLIVSSHVQCLPDIFRGNSTFCKWTVYCDPDDRSVYYTVEDDNENSYVVHFMPSIDGKLFIEIMNEDTGVIYGTDTFSVEELEGLEIWDD